MCPCRPPVLPIPHGSLALVCTGYSACSHAWSTAYADADMQICMCVHYGTKVHPLFRHVLCVLACLSNRVSNCRTGCIAVKGKGCCTFPYCRTGTPLGFRGRI